MPILQLQKISKRFGPVTALKEVNLTVEQGTVHALIGENGAGKSTLMKILSGAYFADSGSIQFKDKPYTVRNPASARDAGIAMIYQELTLAPHLSVAENICLGIEDSILGFNHPARDRIRECLTLLGHPQLDINTPVSALSISMRQIVEIARALYSNASVVIMDEPTSSLTAADTKALFEVIKRLKSNDISIIYISHFLEEVRQIADYFTVLRDGESVATGKTADVPLEKIVEHMVGRTLEEMYPPRQHKVGSPVLKVNSISAFPQPEKVSLELHKGEILGIAGLVGSGRTETLRTLFGLDRAVEGEVTIKDQPEIKAYYLSPMRSLANGLDMLSENRQQEGLATSLPIATNVTLSALPKQSKFGFINLRKEYKNSQVWCRELSVKCRDPLQEVNALSGGNQQKVAIARILNHNSDIVFMDEPTRGIDVGSKAEIYRLIMAMAAMGKAIVTVSSYLPELLGVCDSLAVMHRGKMSSVRKIEEWDEHSIMLYATSGQIEQQCA